MISDWEILFAHTSFADLDCLFPCTPSQLSTGLATNPLWLSPLLPRVCHSDLVLTAGDPEDGEAAGAFLSAIPDKVSMTWSLPELCQGSSWDGNLSLPPQQRL